MIFDFRWIAVFLVNCFAVFCFQMLNDTLAPHSVYLILLGPLLVIPAFYLGAYGTIINTTLTALLWIAAYPVNANVFLPFCLIVNTFVFLNRSRLVRNLNTQIITIAFAVNLIWITWMALTAPDNKSPAWWGRIVMDGIFSQIAVIIACIWLHSFLQACLKLVHLLPETDD